MASIGCSGGGVAGGLRYEEVEHELKTPLAVIRSLGEILRDHPDLDADERHRFLRLLLEEAERLAHTVERLLGDPTLQEALR